MTQRDANEKTRDSNNYNAQKISVITIITYLSEIWMRCQVLLFYYLFIVDNFEIFEIFLRCFGFLLIILFSYEL